MAEQQIAFELVSPEQLVVSEDVDMVVVPGAEGEIGVLVRHAPLITSLKPGTVRIYDNRTVRTRYFVAGGFAEVTGERCTVLAEHPMKIEELDRGAAEQDLKDAREDLADAKDERGRADAERRIELNEAKLRVIDQQG